jgi:regulator of replication initiation timing
MNLSEKIDSIVLKVRELAFKLERLKKENAVLREENKELQAEVERLVKASADAPKEEKNGQPSNEEEVQGESAQSEKLRAQIDQYIREIDQCIEWLNNN